MRDIFSRFPHAVVGSRIDIFVIDRAADPLDEDVIAPGVASVYGQLYAMANYRLELEFPAEFPSRIHKQLAVSFNTLTKSL